VARSPQKKERCHFFNNMADQVWPFIKEPAEKELRKFLNQTFKNMGQQSSLRTKHGDGKKI